MFSARLLASDVQSFDLDAGDAGQTLKQFAKQARVSIVFDPESVKGVLTHEVVGMLLPSDALERMLDGTPLVSEEDLESGAFAVTRSEVPSSDQSSKSPNTSMTEQTSSKKNLYNRIVTAFAAAIAASAPSEIAAQGEGENEIYELSPFVVDAATDDGYRATTTLAGTRLNTQLRDVGAAISVMTSELFNDIGATDAGSLLSYGLNTETTGVQGNYVGGNAVVGAATADLADVRISPQQGQRVRGLASADLTRNYFQTDIGFDTYNTERVTISRGPNSLLFGIGSPGGVINNTTMQASTNSDFGEVSVRLGERSSHRETFNYNRAIIQDRLGVRIAGMYDKYNYQQRPTFDEKHRLYMALDAVLLENEESNILDKSILRLNYEDGEETSNPPNVVPPGDAISNWLTGVDPDLENIPGVVFPDRLDNFTPKWTVDQRNPGDVGIGGEGTGGTGIGLLNEADFPGPVDVPQYLQIALVYEDVTNNAGPGVSGTALSTGSQHEARAIRTLNSFGGRGGRVWDYYFPDSIYNELYVPSFTIPSLPLSVFDNENMAIHGTTNRVEREFDTVNLGVEQTFWNGKAGIEVNYDKQRYETVGNLPFTTGSHFVPFNSISVDVQEYLNDGTPNPNLGRAIIFSPRSQDPFGSNAEIMGQDTFETNREATRVTAFADIDFTNREDGMNWLGRHVVTGLWSTQKRDTTKKGYFGSWDSEQVLIGGGDYLFAPTNAYRRGVISQVYLTPPLHNDSNVNSISDVKITNYIDIDKPMDGEGFQSLAYNRTLGRFEDVGLEARQFLTAFNRDIRDIETEVISMQSFLLNGHVVGLLGYRTDEQSLLINPAQPRFPSGEIDIARANVLEAPRDPVTGEFEPPEKGDTFTWSVVAHTPDALMEKLPLSGLSFHYNESENFNPVGVRTDIEGFLISPPTSETVEYGFTANFLNNRIMVRANWFETTEKNGTASARPFEIYDPVNFWMVRYYEEPIAQGYAVEEILELGGFEPDFWGSYDELINGFVGLLPQSLQDLGNYRPEIQNGVSVVENDWDLVQNLSSTRDFTSEGFEVDIVGQITDNWRVMLNVGQQETIQNNIAPKTLAAAAEFNENLQAAPFLFLNDDPIRGTFTFADRWAQNFTRLLSAATQEGTVSLEQRKWRWNAVTNYDFKEGRFAGLGIGAGVRWQDKAATGYPLLPLNEQGIALPDLANPFYGPDQLNGDIWISYQRKILNDEVDWKIQLNVRNAFGDNDIIPVTTNPDGRVAVYRNSLPIEAFLTNTFSF